MEAALDTLAKGWHALDRVTARYALREAMMAAIEYDRTVQTTRDPGFVEAVEDVIKRLQAQEAEKEKQEPAAIDELQLYRDEVVRLIEMVKKLTKALMESEKRNYEFVDAELARRQAAAAKEAK